MSALDRLNRLPIWRRPVRVWDASLQPPTLDRWIYLRMHRAGRMGAADRAYFSAAITAGMHVADVGANIGLYSLLFARLAGPTGRVFAFEPDPAMASALRANVDANGAGVQVFECALGARAGAGVVRRHGLNSGDNRLSVGDAGDRAGTRVDVHAMADLLPGERLDFVKIDVQGWEHQVIAGLAPLLDINPAMRIYFEFWPYGLAQAGTPVKAFAALFETLGLQVWRPGATGEAVRLLSVAGSLRGQAYTNLLASRMPPQ
jgi:FkbM family methyltransferase